MTRTQLLGLAAALMAALSMPAPAQSGTKMQLRPESKLTLAGGSNVHDWACTTSSLSATIELDSGYQTTSLSSVSRPITSVVVNIPVKSLKCGHGKMDDNMYKALKADQFPEIKYVLSSYEVDKAKATDDGFAALTHGELTVAGTTRTVDIPITALRQTGGSMRGEGAVSLKITDFGIKPPVAMLGTMRTKNEIEIKFDVRLDRSVVVALSQQP